MLDFVGIGHFQTWLGCFLSEMATARFGEEHAFPLALNARGATIATL